MLIGKRNLTKVESLGTPQRTAAQRIVIYINMSKSGLDRFVD